jgi:hypothetical protein
MKRRIFFLVGCTLFGSGCGGSSDTTPLVAGRALLGSGGCGAPPPSGVCENPVVYAKYPHVRLDFAREFEETTLATTTTDTEGNFTVRLPAGAYRVNTPQMGNMGVLVNVTDPPTSITTAFYQPPP